MAVRKKKSPETPAQREIREEKERVKKEKELIFGAKLTPRFDADLLKTLDVFMENQSIDTRNLSVVQAVHVYLHDFYLKDDNIIMLKPVLSLMLDSTSKEKLERNTTAACKIVMLKMKSQLDPFKPFPSSELRRRLRHWHELNCIPVNRIYGEKPNQVTYTITHNMGEKFSEFQCLLTTKLILLLDNVVSNKKVDADSFSIVVEWEDK